MQVFSDALSDSPIGLNGAFVEALLIASIVGFALLLTLQWAARNLSLIQATAFQATFFITVLFIATISADSITPSALLNAAIVTAAVLGIAGLMLSFRNAEVEQNKTEPSATVTMIQPGQQRPQTKHSTKAA
jgi:hypothetical protein